MSVDAHALKLLVDGELEHLSDTRALIHIRGLLVEPTIVFRRWNYGQPNEQYPCWSVLEDDASNTGIAYCENGFGPRNPWGLVWLGGDDSPMLIGMDSSWFPRFLDACFESRAATDLPIWRVFRIGPLATREPITDEYSWDVVWRRLSDIRLSEPSAKYEVGHNIAYIKD